MWWETLVQTLTTLQYEWTRWLVEDRRLIVVYVGQSRQTDHQWRNLTCLTQLMSLDLFLFQSSFLKSMSLGLMD